jgi:hypothetical protein
MIRASFLPLVCLAALACRSPQPPAATATGAVPPKGRYALEGTPASIRPPDGWTKVPIETSGPLMAFESQPVAGASSEPVLVLQRIASGPVRPIDELAAVACGAGQPIEPPMTTRLGDRSVLQCAFDSKLAVRVNGGRAQMVPSRRRQYVIADGGDVYVCAIGMDRSADSPAARALLDDFCGSLEFAP